MRMGIAKSNSGGFMKKVFPTPATKQSFVYIRSARRKAYVFGALILLVSCTSTQVRWDAVKMRQDVMVYYNDQIMENLIRAKKHLPFVHVDIQTLTSAGASSVTGSIGYGESITNSSTSARTNQTMTTDATSTLPPSTMHSVATIAGGLLATATHAAMRPFAYSVSPTRSETLTITSAPALGAQAQASPEPLGTPTLTLSKVTDTTDKSDSTKNTYAEECTLVSPTPKPVKTIYDIYQTFANSGYLSRQRYQPRDGYYVPGTLKKWTDKEGTWYYFIEDVEPNKKEYYEFCKKLFNKGSGGSLEQKVQALTGRLETLQATPP
ncbi:MAG: hypothetical protein C5B58_02375 [Acidobacteria bacterium]|nr:MAG: hypothetical protein C5B58_02375 [Acidobacteriota bacterium]